MSEMISHSYEKSAFMGERAREQKFYNKVEETAKKLDNALNPKILDDISKRKINGDVSKVVWETTWELPWKIDNAQDLIDKTQPASNSTEPNKNEAKKRVEVLAYSTYVAIKNGKNEELINALGTNDGLAIDKVLPVSLRGIGSKVAEIGINEEITNPQLKDALKKLDRKTEILRINGSISDENLKNVIEDKVMELSELVDSLDDKGYEELKKVSAFLGAEMERMSNKAGKITKEALNQVKHHLPPEVIPGKPGEEGERGWEQRSYDMTYKRFVELEQEQVNPNWFPARPPEWYSDMKDKKDRQLIDVRIKLLEAAATKHEVRNKLPVEKLRGVKPEINGKEFNLLWENMPGFKEAMSTIVKDLCQTYTDLNDPEQRVFLRLKNTEGMMDENVLGWLSNFDSFRKHVAETVASIDGRKKISSKDNEAVSAAWNFIFLGDAIESWDYFRQLKPSDVVSDKLRTTFHLKSKFLGKNGIYKVTGIKKEAWGEEEPFISNQMFQWVAHNLDVNRDEFIGRVLRGDLKDIVPDTMAVSMIELMPAKLKDGRETSMALALMGKDQNGKEVKLDQIIGPPENDLNIMQTHNDMVEGADWISQAIKGDQPLDMNKNLDAWAKLFVQCTGLTRQEPFIPRIGVNDRDHFGKLSFPDSPMFYWSVLLNSVGFNPTDKFPLLDLRKLASNNGPAVASNYDLALRDLLDIIGVRSKVDPKKVKEILGGANIADYTKKKMGNDKARYGRLRTI